MVQVVTIIMVNLFTDQVDLNLKVDQVDICGMVMEHLLILLLQGLLVA